MRIPSWGWSAAPATALLSLLLIGLVPLAAFGQSSEDGYLAGYVAAVLERQLNVSARSLKVRDGVVTIDAADLPRADRPKIMTAITAVRGVTRVEIREGRMAPLIEAEQEGEREQRPGRDPARNAGSWASSRCRPDRRSAWLGRC